MIISSFMPYISVIMAVTMPTIKRMMDSKDPFKTKKKSIAGLRSLWFCPDFLIYVK